MRKKSQSHTIQLSSQSNSHHHPLISHHKYPVLVLSIGIQLQVSVTVGQAIDRCFLPCRGAPTYPPRSINSSRTHFPGSCPASAKQYAATRPRLNREVKHAGLNLCPQGSWAIPTGTPAHCMGGWWADLATSVKRQELTSPTRRAPLSR